MHCKGLRSTAADSGLFRRGNCVQPARSKDSEEQDASSSFSSSSFRFFYNPPASDSSCGFTKSSLQVGTLRRSPSRRLVVASSSSPSSSSPRWLLLAGGTTYVPTQDDPLLHTPMCVWYSHARTLYLLGFGLGQTDPKKPHNFRTRAIVNVLGERYVSARPLEGCRRGLVRRRARSTGFFFGGYSDCRASEASLHELNWLRAAGISFSLRARSQLSMRESLAGVAQGAAPHRLHSGIFVLLLFSSPIITEKGWWKLKFLHCFSIVLGWVWE